LNNTPGLQGSIVLKHDHNEKGKTVTGTRAVLDKGGEKISADPI